MNMDMSASFRPTVQFCLPKAKIVVDHFPDTSFENGKGRDLEKGQQPTRLLLETRVNVCKRFQFSGLLDSGSSREGDVVE